MIPSPLRRVALVGVVLLVGVAAACGDDSTADSTQTTVAPEDVKVPIEDVVAALPAVAAGGAAAAAAATAGDFDEALDAYDDLHEAWEGIEGTVKDTDPDAYEAIETAQGLIRDGAENEQAERVVAGAEDQYTAINAFVAENS